MPSTISEYDTDLSQKHAEIYREDSSLYWFSSTIQKFLISLLPANKEAAVLDLACGSGEYCHRVAALGYKEVVGIDISAAQISECHKRRSSRQRVPHFIQANAADLLNYPQFHEKFDAVNAAWLYSAASDVEQFSRMIRSSAACLKKGGLLTAVDVNFDIRPSEPAEWDDFGISVLDDKPFTYRPKTGDAILGRFDMLSDATATSRADRTTGVEITVTFFDKSIYGNEFARSGLNDLHFFPPSEWPLEQLASSPTNADRFRRYSMANPDLVGMTAVKGEAG